MDKETIEKINAKCPYGQGIFLQPYGIPDDIKELVIYSSYESGGVSGGSCWDSSNPQPYTEERPKDHMEVLDIVLKTVAPDISYLQYREIEKLIHDNRKSEWEYYGNRTDHEIQYILLSDLEKLLDNI